MCQGTRTHWFCPCQNPNCKLAAYHKLTIVDSPAWIWCDAYLNSPAFDITRQGIPPCPARAFKMAREERTSGNFCAQCVRSECFLYGKSSGKGAGHR